jgi:hypothetical protein
LGGEAIGFGFFGFEKAGKAPCQQLRRPNHHRRRQNDKHDAHHARQSREKTPRIVALLSIPKLGENRDESERNRAARDQLIEEIGQLEGVVVSVVSLKRQKRRDDDALKQSGETRQK